MTFFAFRGVKSHGWTFYDPITISYWKFCKIHSSMRVFFNQPAGLLIPEFARVQSGSYEFQGERFVSNNPLFRVFSRFEQRVGKSRHAVARSLRRFYDRLLINCGFRVYTEIR